MPNNNIIATTEDAVKDIEKEEADMIHTKISLILQNSKPLKDNLSKDECKALQELQSDISIVVYQLAMVDLPWWLFGKMYGSYKQWSISITLKRS